MSQETQKSGGSSAKWLALIVVILAIVVGGIWIYRLLDEWIDLIIYSFVALLIIIPLFINRQMVSKILAWIKDTYKRHTALGVLATVGAVIAFLPFSAFLIAKTIWEFFVVKKKKKGKVLVAEEHYDAESEENFLDDSSNSLDGKIPPTDQ